MKVAVGCRSGEGLRDELPQGPTSARCGTAPSSNRSEFAMARSRTSRMRSLTYEEPSRPSSVHTKSQRWTQGDSNRDMYAGYLVEAEYLVEVD